MKKVPKKRARARRTMASEAIRAAVAAETATLHQAVTELVSQVTAARFRSRETDTFAPPGGEDKMVAFILTMCLSLAASNPTRMLGEAVTINDLVAGPRPCRGVA